MSKACQNILFCDDQAARNRWLARQDQNLVKELCKNCGAMGEGNVGAVSSGSPYATKAGFDVLKKGGSAADAAAAAGFVMMVTDPPNASPAGRGHILWARPGERPIAINGATKAPQMLPDGQIRREAPAIPVPGIVRAVLKLHQTGGRLPLNKVAIYARDLAQNGFEVPKELATIWAWRAPEFQDPDARRHYLPEGRAPCAGETFYHPGLAAFFDLMMASGTDPFLIKEYSNPFCARLEEKGGLWRFRDLEEASPLKGETALLEGDGWRLTSTGRQGWGPVLLQMVELVTSLGPKNELEAELFHLLAVFLVLQSRSSKSSGQVEVAQERDTTHLSVIDAQGMRVALTQSIGPHFGAKVADPDTGILLAHSYQMALNPVPGERDVTEQCPCLFELNGDVYALGGAGSERIPGAVAAVVRHLLYGSNLAKAVSAARSNWIGATARLHVDVPEGLEARLAAAGSKIEFTGRGPVNHLGIVQAAGMLADGRVTAAADPAYAGLALAG